LTPGAPPPHSDLARGIRKGERFAILSPNLPEYAIAFHAVASLGGVVTIVNPLYTPSEETDGTRLIAPTCADSRWGINARTQRRGDGIGFAGLSLGQSPGGVGAR